MNLNVTPGGIPIVVHLSQYDSESRTLEFDLYDGDSSYTPPSGASATIRGTKPDNTGYEYPCTISGSKVTVTVQPQMTVVGGKHRAEIRITSGSKILGTANFTFDVEPSALSDNTSISETDLPMIEKAAENVDEAQAAATAAAESASAASTSETNAAASATAAAASAAAAKTSESNAATSQAAAKASEESAATSSSEAQAALSSVTSLLAEAQAAQAAAEQAAESASADAVTAAGYAGAAEFSLGIDPTTGRLGLFKNTTTTEATT